MKARLLKEDNGTVKLLCSNGSISDTSVTILSNFLINFKNADSFSGDLGKWNESHGDMALHPGKTIAYITDDYNLVIMDFEVFEPLISETYKLKSYITLGEYAEKHDKSREIIKVFCRTNRLVGAQKICGRWMIPEDSPYPVSPERQREGWQRKR